MDEFVRVAKLADEEEYRVRVITSHLFTAQQAGCFLFHDRLQSGPAVLVRLLPVQVESVEDIWWSLVIWYCAGTDHRQENAFVNGF